MASWPARLSMFTPASRPKMSACLKNPLLSLTPHIGGSTKEAQKRIGAEIVEIITEFFA